ncbi:MAG: hypothetical protein ACLGIG_10315 [Actinomycetes bacterium]
MLRAALVLWLAALAGTTALFVLVVSTQRVVRWTARVRRVPQSAVTVPAQRARGVSGDRVAG